MRIPIAVVITAFVAVLSPSSVWAQGTASAGSAPAAEHPDEIVRMHQKVAAANREYDREEAAAEKVFDQKKAVAQKKRDAAIEAAEHGVGG